jgi:hypothetical protein
MSPETQNITGRRAPSSIMTMHVVHVGDVRVNIAGGPSETIHR